MFFERHLHMLPYSIILLLGDRHVLMRFPHSPSLVYIRPTEYHREEVCYRVMQYCNVTHVLEVKDVQVVIV